MNGYSTIRLENNDLFVKLCLPDLSGAAFTIVSVITLIYMANKNHVIFNILLPFEMTNGNWRLMVYFQTCNQIQKLTIDYGQKY